MDSIIYQIMISVRHCTAVQMYFLVQKIALFGLLGTKKFKILAQTAFLWLLFVLGFSNHAALSNLST